MNGDRVGRVALVGGTHGNEWVGAWLVERWSKLPAAVRRPTFECLPLLGNPAAFARRLRYVDRDLNRCFGSPSAAPDAPQEVRRAHEILATIGPDGKTPVEVVLDLHTTTANMGLSFIVTNLDRFNLRMAAWVQRREPRLKVYAWIDETLPNSALSGIVPRGATIEVGPTPNNVVRADLLLGTERVVQHCLDFIEAHNQGALEASSPGTLDVYAHLRSYDYPRDTDDRILAVVHPDLQDRDYQPLKRGDPVFLTLSGETIRFEGPEPEVYPVFVNEAAYYEKRLAFSVTRRETLSI